MREMTGFVLAGGKSTRMGENKAFLLLEGKPLIDYAIAQARSLCEDVFIVGQKELYGAFGRIVKDVYEDCGPLAGIQAALLRSYTELNLVVGVDTPFVQHAFLRWLAEEADKSGALVTVPETSAGKQPLCAFYHKDFAPLAESALKAGRYRVDAAFPEGKTRVVRAEEWEALGFAAQMFDNLNTREEYEKALERKVRGQQA